MESGNEQREAPIDRTKFGKRKAATADLDVEQPAKRGRPSKLSPSQRRKLARLYLYTNMRVEDICKIIGSRQMDVKKRTVQNILREMLASDYNRLRPKDEHSRRKRLAQMRLLGCTIGIDKEKRRLKCFPGVIEESSIVNSSMSIPAIGLESSTLDDGEAVNASNRGARNDGSLEPTDLQWEDFFDLEMASDLLLLGDQSLGTWDTSEPLVDCIPDLSLPSNETGTDHPCISQLPEKAALRSEPLLPATTEVEDWEIGTSLWEKNKVDFAQKTVDTTTDEIVPSLALAPFQLSPYAFPETFFPDSAAIYPEKFPWGQLYTPDDYSVQTRAFEQELALEQEPLRRISSKQNMNKTTMASHQRTQRVSDRSKYTSSPASFFSLSPCVNGMLRYSPAHREDIKTVFYNSPALFNPLSSSISMYVEPVEDISNSQKSVVDMIVPCTCKGDDPPSSTTCLVYDVAKSQHEKIRMANGIPADLDQQMLENNMAHYQDQLGAPKLPGSFISLTVKVLRLMSASERKNLLEADWLFCEACFVRFSYPTNYGCQDWNAHDTRCPRCSSYVNVVDRYGNTLLHVVAALGESMNNLRPIISDFAKNTKLDAVNTAGETFMHILDPFRIGHEIPSLLSACNEAGFNFDQRDLLGQTIVHALVRRGVNLSLLRDHHCLLMLRDFSGHSSMLSHTLLSGSGLYDSNGSTALIRVLHKIHYADGYTSIGDLQRWIESANSRDKAGRSPLHFAVGFGNIEATKLLLQHGVNVHARDVSGQSVLGLADTIQSRILHNERMYMRIAACQNLVADAGAVRVPTLYDEWSMQKVGGKELKPDKFSTPLPIFSNDDNHPYTHTDLRQTRLTSLLPDGNDEPQLI